MTEFRDCLESICQHVDGVLTATLMGVDGLPIETVERPVDGQVDVSSLLIEYSNLVKQVQQSAQVFAAGDLEELSIQSERVTAILRAVTPEYFLILALAPSANIGKCRYLLRLHAPSLIDELS